MAALSTARATGAVAGPMSPAAALSADVADRRAAMAGPDAGRFGAMPTARNAQDTSMAALGVARAMGSVPRASPDPARFGEKAPDTARFGPAPTARSAQDSSMAALGLARATGAITGKTGRVGTGLAAGLAGPDPARFGGVAPTAPASSLRTSPNYGIGFAQQRREAEDMSLARQDAWSGLLGTIQKAEAQKAKNPATGAVDPYNGLVGPEKGRKTPTHADLTNMTISEVQSYQKGMMRAGHLSTAVGSYQMLSKTLKEATVMAGYDPNTTKFTKSVQDELARTIADDKRAKPGQTPKSYARSLAQEWAGFATEDGTSYYGKDGVNKATTSYSNVLGAASALVNSGAVGPDRLAGTSKVPGSTRAPGAVNPAAGTPTTRNAPSTPTRTSVAPKNAPTPTSRPSTTTTDPARFAEKYLGGVPTPTARPTDAPKVRSPVDKVLAGAIDVGVGMIPGIGTVAGVYGMAAPMLGLPTVGEMALNVRDTNQFSLNESLAKARRESGAPERTGSTVRSTPASAPREVASVASFSEKYLGYSDPTVRQTPEQKWGGMGTPTAGYVPF